jgi:hypothetical protein
MAGSVVISNDRVPLVLRAIETLTKSEVLIGIPGDAAERKPEPGQTAPPQITNAALGYIHEFGLPEHNIPARPFLRPGIQEAMPAIIARLRGAALKVLANLDDPETAQKELVAVGLTAQNAVRRYMNRGIPPPLAQSTLYKRAGTKGKPRKGGRLELARRAAGGLPGVDLAKPLIWTAQLRNSVSFVVRSRRR